MAPQVRLIGAGFVHCTWFDGIQLPSRSPIQDDPSGWRSRLGRSRFLRKFPIGIIWSMCLHWKQIAIKDFMKDVLNHLY